MPACRGWAATLPSLKESLVDKNAARACLFMMSRVSPGDKAGRAIPARPWRVGASMRRPRPCARGPSRACQGTFAARGGGRWSFPAWLRPGGALWLLPLLRSWCPGVPLCRRCRPGRGGRLSARRCGPVASAGGCAGRFARSPAWWWLRALLRCLPRRRLRGRGAAGVAVLAPSVGSRAVCSVSRCRSRRCGRAGARCLPPCRRLRCGAWADLRRAGAVLRGRSGRCADQRLAPALSPI